ncbi:sulfite oxidase [Nannocystis sp. SCPEA4]|uniref:sulfite oxidase n=1 Tax=Nannocystis sp. SCPEA4 TaxID=2996787 RepID=UPI002271782E|nr:sulfite oxidase [Nannocystis sp. SCPEA4]
MRIIVASPGPSRRQLLTLLGGAAVFAACRSRNAPTSGALVKALPPETFIPHEPYSAETRLDSLPTDSLITPTASFYVRNHGPTPLIAADTWSLRVDGEGVARPLSLSYAQLLTMPSVRAIRYLECAGNGRAYFDELMHRPAEGSPWRDGGYGVAEWIGVRLAEILHAAGLRPNAAWVTPISLDGEGYARPMPLAKALADDTLVAHSMNGAPLPPDHGFPARVVVPGWVGAASVKWVGALEVTVRQPSVKMNTEEYVFLGPDYPKPPPPLTTGVVKSAVCLPWPAVLPPGRQPISGLAWSPFGRIARVEVSLDGGRTYRPARLVGDNLPVAGVRWQFDLDAVPGDMTVTPRAVDEYGNGQPDLAAQKWNEKGYLFAAPVPHPLHIV